MDLNIAKASSISSDRLIASLMSGVRTLDPATAFRILNKRDIADKHLVMRRLLEAPQSDGQVKLEAALALGRSQHRNKVKILLDQLTKGDDLARFGALRALSRLDKPELFDEIRAFRAEAKAGFIKREALFAETILAYRLNLSEGNIKVPTGRKTLAPGKDAVSIALRKSKLSAEQIGEIRKAFKPQAIGFNTAKSPVFSARCGKRDLFLLFHDELSQSGSLDWMLEGKTIPLVVGYREFCPETYSAAFHLFCHPARKRGSVTLHGLNSRGGIVLVGEGRAEGSTLSFSLKSLDAPGQFGLDIDGTFDGARKTLTFNKALSEPRIHRPGPLKAPRPDD